MEEFTGTRDLVYKSRNIYERRRRILREARKMLSESGLAKFSVRELCIRAGIAPKTLYNAYGSKESVIATAIRQYLADFNDRVKYKFSDVTLEGRLERLIKVHSRNIQVRQYTTAIMVVYGSPTADRAVREAIRNVSQLSLAGFASHLQATGQLAPGVSAASLIYHLTTGAYAVLSDWCLGDLQDDELVDRISEAFLIILMGTTQGVTAEETRRWLEDLRGNRPSWRALRKMAQAMPPEIRASERAVAARRTDKASTVPLPTTTDPQPEPSDHRVRRSS
jgi:AcrR family transcriptional regulator